MEKKKFTTKIKEGFSNKKENISKAYNLGYKKGWEEANNIPKGFLTTTSATIGFKNGIKGRRKSDKYTNTYNK